MPTVLVTPHLMGAPSEPSATRRGPVVGSVLFWGVVAGPESTLRRAINAGFIPEDLLATNQVGVVRFVLVGPAVMLLMIFRPQGIFGNREEMLLDAR